MSYKPPTYIIQVVLTTWLLYIGSVKRFENYVFLLLFVLSNFINIFHKKKEILTTESKSDFYEACLYIFEG